MADEHSQRLLLERAARELRQARVRLSAAEKTLREPVAVLGAAVRMPGGVDDLDRFWGALADRKVMVGPLLDSSDGDRSSSAPRVEGAWAGLLADVSGFDAGFFRISPAEADQMDPQQRLLLEVAWGAIEDASLTPEMLRAQTTGVYVGVYGNDYALLQMESPESISAYTAAGSAHSIVANRLSYQLDLTGPSIAVDSACSSSLAAVHLACQGLRCGDCDLAIVAGVNVVLSPKSTAVTGQALPLAAGGECRPFDADAEGIVRSEGCGVVVLQLRREVDSEARATRGTILATAMNQDGRTNGMTAPNPRAQVAVIERAVADAGIDRERVVYVETHGTGTALGDPIEVQALRQAYGRGRRRCMLGSLKANFGHLEASAGIAGLIKALLVLEHGTSPPQARFQRLNPAIDLDGCRLGVSSEPSPLPRLQEPSLAAVSSFGFGGTNVHAILEAPEASATAGAQEEAPAALMLPLSARSPGALAALAGRYGELMAGGDGRLVADVCSGAALGRGHLDHRLCAVASDPIALGQELAVKARQPSPPRAAAPQVIWIFSGQGSQWAGMASAAMGAEPVLRREIEDCDEEVRALAGWSIVEELRAPAEASRLGETEVAQLTIAAVQFGIVALLHSWGVEPDALVGHSMGEVVAACVGGWLRRSDGFELLLARARLIERCARGGAMVSLRLSEERVEQMIADGGGRVAVGAVNGPRSTVVSGGSKAVEELASQAEAAGARCRRLDVDYAFHSPLLERGRLEMEEAAAAISGVGGVIPLYSTVTGEAIAAEQINGEYWGRNLCDAVRFWDALQSAKGDSPVACVEIGPHPVLTSQVLDEFHSAGEGDVAIGTLRRDSDPAVSLRRAIAMLYERGCDPRWEQVVARRESVTLPSYPWQRSFHWIGGSAEGGPETAGDDPLSGLRSRLSSASREERAEILSRTVHEVLTRFLELEEGELTPDTPLEALEIDSLAVVELRGRIEAELDAPVPLQGLLEAETPADIVTLLAGSIGDAERVG